MLAYPDKNLLDHFPLQRECREQRTLKMNARAMRKTAVEQKQEEVDTTK